MKFLLIFVFILLASIKSTAMELVDIEFKHNSTNWYQEYEKILLGAFKIMEEYPEATLHNRRTFCIQ